ncbi:uncharacterized protein LOC132320724 [Gavia stellata]|uniref:uncharacterized protein LOC132320724 n=1 Tax=Gavia stellata TaxID=37040 RepID=UPI002897DA11|nr:uncharacterized protein LOC132320724 [Gavia stellata]
MNKQQMQALVDTGAEVTIIHGNPGKHKGETSPVWGLGDQPLIRHLTHVTLQIGNWPPRSFRLMIAQIGEYIIGTDILRGQILELPDGLWAFGSARQLRIWAIQVGKVPDKANIPVAHTVVHLKQYRIPGGKAEIEQTIQDLLQVGMVQYTHSPFNSPIWPVKKLDGSWRMTVDYREVNKVSPPITAAVPEVAELVHQIQVHPGTWYAVIDVANAFFTVPIPIATQEQFAFTWGGTQYTFTRLHQGYIHSPTFCHQAIHKTLQQVSREPKTRVVQYINDILIQGPSQEQVQQQLDYVLDRLRQDGWVVNPKKVQGPSDTVKYLAIILKPLYVVTRKKAHFQWEQAQQEAFEQAKHIVQEYLELHTVQDGPVKLHVSLERDVALWSLWQLQDGSRRPLGFWSRQLTGAELRYTVFEKQLVAVYWALLHTEARTLGHEVLVQTETPVIAWATTPSTTRKIGHAQEATIIKMGWYLQERAKPGPKDLTKEQKEFAWFTDGSCSAKGHWRAIAYNPATSTTLSNEGETGSALLAELVAAWQAIDTTPPNHICSWAVAQGLVHWLPKWHADQWHTGSQDVWGHPYWERIWALLRDRDVRVFHVDAHMKEQSETHLGNAQAYALAKVQAVKLEEQSNAALAWWAHEKAGHGGRDATIAWAKARGTQLPVKDVQTCIAQCETCQLLKKHPYLDQPVGRIRWGTTGGEVWQIDYVGPLWEHRRQRYICVAMDTYSGLIVAVPSLYSNAYTAIKCLEIIELYYGTPVETNLTMGRISKTSK